jgi:catechol 2,3-dioxygenase-like lactoylglutathione lyase family enzyme
MIALHWGRAAKLGVAIAALSLGAPAHAENSAKVPQVLDVAPSRPAAHPRLAAFKVHEVDLDKAVAYYQTVFGMRLIGTIGGSSVREALLAYPDAAIPATQPKGSIAEPILVLVLDPRFVHSDSKVQDLVFRVPSIEATRKAAEAAGYRSPAGNGERSLSDPSGNLVELVADGYLSPKRP